VRVVIMTFVARPHPLALLLTFIAGRF